MGTIESLPSSFGTLIRNAVKKGEAVKILRDGSELWRVIYKKETGEYFIYEDTVFIAHFVERTEGTIILNFGGLGMRYADRVNQLCRHFSITEIEFEYDHALNMVTVKV